MPVESAEGARRLTIIRGGGLEGFVRAFGRTPRERWSARLLGDRHARERGSLCSVLRVPARREHAVAEDAIHANCVFDGRFR